MSNPSAPSSDSQDLDVHYPVPGEPLHVSRKLRAPEWLQIAVIAGLLGAGLYVFTEGRYLWCGLLLVAGTTFGLAFILRRMIGDDYDRV